VKENYPRLDILINNAAQTLRRPPAYYRSLCKKENKLPEDSLCVDVVMKQVGQDPWKENVPDKNSGEEERPNNLLAIESAVRSFSLLSSSTVISGRELSTGISGSKILDAQISKFSEIAPSAVLTQIPLVPSDVLKDPENFPPGQLDMYGEQLDLRRETSWVKKVTSVDPVEVAEVQLVNSVVPFMFLSQLTELLSKSPDRSFVVNVSSPEGQFSATKSGEHVHTNMAKAALNMMTLTVAKDMEFKNIYVTSVDTGWVSRMRPGMAGNKSCDAPLTPADGAARVLHPVFDGLVSAKPYSGVFLKNFVVSTW
jgi:NAD(P)-dependent dehydrogenase (short-subunit alcohol dehydrogenase family)